MIEKSIAHQLTMYQLYDQSKTLTALFAPDPEKKDSRVYTYRFISDSG